MKRKGFVGIIIFALIISSMVTVFADLPPLSDNEALWAFGGEEGDAYVLKGHGVGYTCTIGAYSPTNSLWTVSMPDGSYRIKNGASPYECVTRAQTQQSDSSGVYYNCIGRPYNESGIGSRQKLIFYTDTQYIKVSEGAAYLMSASTTVTSCDAIFRPLIIYPKGARWAVDVY